MQVGIGSEWPPEARQPGIKLNQPASQPREKKGLQKKGKKRRGPKIAWRAPKKRPERPAVSTCPAYA